MAIGGGCVVTVWGFRLSPAGLGSASEVRNERGGHQTWGSLWFRFGGRVRSKKPPLPSPEPEA